MLCNATMKRTLDHSEIPADMTWVYLLFIHLFYFIFNFLGILKPYGKADSREMTKERDMGNEMQQRSAVYCLFSAVAYSPIMVKVWFSCAHNWLWVPKLLSTYWTDIYSQCWNKLMAWNTVRQSILEPCESWNTNDRYYYTIDAGDVMDNNPVAGVQTIIMLLGNGGKSWEQQLDGEGITDVRADMMSGRKNAKISKLVLLPCQH